MPQYGEVRVDFITYTTGVAPNEGNVTVPISGLINAPTFSGDVVIEGGLTVSGLSTFNDITVTGDATIGGDLTVSGDINASGVTISGINGLFASGTEAAPSISFVDDTDTGLYSPSANEVAISTSGTGRLFVDANGRVGVGVASSDLRFLVSGSGVIGGISSSSANSYFAFRDSGTTAPNNVLIGSAANDLVAVAGGYERLRIDSSGNVGVGTSSPGYKLDVNGEVVFSPNTAGKNTFYFTTNASNDASLFLKSDTTDKVNIQANGTSYFNGGNVGIGTSSPSVTFEVTSAADNTEYMRVGPLSSASTRSLRFSAEASSGGTANTTHIINAPSTAGFLKFQTNSTTAVTIDASQRVGIGVTGPTDKLHLHEASSNANYLHITNDTTGSTAGDGVIVGLDSSEQFYIYSYENNNMIFGTNNAERARIDSSGRLLVGTSTARANYYNSTFSAALQLEGTASNRRLSITGADEGAVVILARQRSGSVGGNTILQSGDNVGVITFQGNDGSEFVEAATINCQVDGTPGADDMPGRLVFSTTADGASSPTERMRIDSSGRIKIGDQPSIADFSQNYLIDFSKQQQTGGINFTQTSPNSFLDLACGGSAANSGGWSGVIRFLTGGSSSYATERMRIDSSGRLLVGTTTATDNTRLDQKLGIVSNSASSGGIRLTQNPGTTASAAPIIDLRKTRGSTDGSHTIVADNDYLGYITFGGADGTDNESQAALITCQVDGTPGANDMPGRLVFSSTPSGSASPVERMRITSDAYVRLASGTGGIQFNGDTAAANALDDYEEGTWTPIIGSNAGNDGSITLSNQAGSYVKIGNRVFAFFKCSMNCSSFSSVSGPMILRNIPFVPSANADSAGKVTRLNGASTNVAGLQYAGTSSYAGYRHFRIYSYGSLTAINYTTIFPNTGTTYTIEGSITYKV